MNTQSNQITKRIRIIHDNDYEWDDTSTINIAYNERSRYILGTQACSPDEALEIHQGIIRGDLIGFPVYAYIHSGISLSIGSVNGVFDNEHSGFIYIKKSDAIGWAGRVGKTKGKICTKKDREAVLKACEGYLKQFSAYLNGEIYGFIQEVLVTYTEHETGRTVDVWEIPEDGNSCIGFIGSNPETNGMWEHVEPLIEDGYVFVDEIGNPIY